MLCKSNNDVFSYETEVILLFQFPFLGTIKEKFLDLVNFVFVYIFSFISPPLSPFHVLPMTVKKLNDSTKLLSI